MSQPRRFLLVPALVVSVALSGSKADGGANPDFRLPLHAQEGAMGSCPSPVDCFVHPPFINVYPETEYVLYLLVFNFSQLAGLQTAFAWSPGWVFFSGQWDCRAGQVNASVPQDPGGATAGALLTTFNCVTGTPITVIGRMSFVSGQHGCVWQVQPSYPGGIQAVDCSGGVDRINPDPYSERRLGKICVMNGGQDACLTLPTSVEAVTWAGIKETYR